MNTDNIRFILFCALGGMVFLLWQAWQKDYPKEDNKAAPIAQTQTTPNANSQANGVSLASAPTANNAAPILSQTQSSGLKTGQKITIETDVLRVIVDTQGGDIRQVTFKNYPVGGGNKQNLNFLNDTAPNFFIVQSGLLSTGENLPDHRALFTAEKLSYQLDKNQDKLEVNLTWQDSFNHKVIKKLVFKRGSYQIDLTQTASNPATAQPWLLSPYVQFWRTPKSAAPEPRFVQTFNGLAFYEQKEANNNQDYRFNKTSYEDLDEKNFTQKQQGGWIGVMQHYFLAAIIPEKGMSSYQAMPQKLDSGEQAYLASWQGEAKTLAPNQSVNFHTNVYLGPRQQANTISALLGLAPKVQGIESLAPGMELAIDYGILSPLAHPLFWLLDFFHNILKNWGLAIIALTFTVKALLYKLSEKQFRSMAKMKQFAPRLQQIKERFGDDKMQQQKAMMELYQKEGFNPMAGCWPMLVSFPVFIALYWVFLESVELRQAPFFGWVQDLTAPDPYWILPVLFGASMFIQQRMSGTSMTMDPMQQRVMQIMPFGMTLFFGFFPAGLVLYWFVSNLIGILQQTYINKKLQKEGLK